MADDDPLEDVEREAGLELETQLELYSRFCDSERHNPPILDHPPHPPPPHAAAAGTAIPPALLELELVDMTSETMDPLEWTARKLISIPKHYYWDMEGIDPEQLPIRLKLWHRSVAAIGTIVRVTDRIGKPITDFLGLTSSRFDYVTSTMTEADWEYSRRIEEQRRRLREPEEEGTQESGDGALP